MKSMNNLFVLALVAASAFTSVAYAADGSRVDLRVPFSFVVSGRTLPPGNYTLVENGSTLFIRGDHQEFIVPSVPTAYTTGSKPRLEFRREGAATYLVGVQTIDETRAVPFHLTPTALPAH